MKQKFYSILFFAFIATFNNIKTTKNEKFLDQYEPQQQKLIEKSKRGSGVGNQFFATEKIITLADIGPKTYSITNPQNFILAHSGNFVPLNEQYGSPMIEVVSSNVTFDGNGFEIKKAATNLAGDATAKVVAFEVGYSPSTSNYSTLSQPQKVVIRNITLKNFEIGIIIHSGVQEVTLEDVTIIGAAVPIIIAGQTAGTAKGEAVNITVKNVNIIGNNLESSATLSWAKAKLETSGASTSYHLGYADDSIFNATIVNPITNSTGLLTYSGIIAKNVINLHLNTVKVDRLGYNGASSETNATGVRGIVIESSKDVFLKDISSSNHIGGLFATGLWMQNCVSVYGNNIDASNMNITRRDTQNVSANRQLNGITSYDCSIVNINGFFSNNNVLDATGDPSFNLSQIVGIYTDTASSLVPKSWKLENISASNNINSLGATVACYMAAGTQSFELNNFSSNNNSGGSEYSGLKLVNDSNVGIKISNFTLNNNSATENTGIFNGILIGSPVGIAQNICISNGEIASSSSKADFTGIIVKKGQNLVIENIDIDNPKVLQLGNLIGYSFPTSLCDLILKNCSMNNGSVATGDIKGINTDTCTSLVIEKFQADKNTATTGNLYGFTTNTSTSLQVKFDDFELVGNTASAGITGIRSDIAKIYSLNNIKINSNTINSSGAFKAFNSDSATLGFDINDFSFNNNATSSGSNVGFAFSSGQNIKISNGEINNNSASGGYFTGMDFTALNNVNINNIAINSNSVNSNDLKGISCNGTNSNFNLNNLNFNLNSTSTTGSIYTVSFSSTLKSSSFYNCNISNNSSIGYFLAYNITNCAGLDFKNIAILSNTAVVNLNGFNFTNAYSSSFENINISGNSTTATSNFYHLYGLEAVSTKNLSLDKFMFKNNTASASTSKAEIIGIYSSNSTQDVEIKNANISSCVTALGNIYGLKAASPKILKINHFSFNNCSLVEDSPDTGEIIGINLLTSCSGVSCDDYNFNNNTINASTGGASEENGRFIGFRAVGITSSELKNLFIEDNESNNNAGYGIQFTDSSNNVIVSDFSVSNNQIYQASKVFYGINIANINTLTLKNGTINNNLTDGASSSGGICKGINFSGTNNNINLDNISVNANSSTGNNVYGIDSVNYLNNSNLNNLNCNYNGAGSSVGNYAYGAKLALVSSTITNSNFNNNYGSSYSYGLYLSDSMSAILDNVSASNNNATDSAIGCYAKKTGSFNDLTIKNSSFNYNRNSETSYASLVTPENTANSTSTISRHFGFSSARTGGYGLLIDGVTAPTLDGVVASSNEGIRSAGIWLQNCNQNKIFNCTTSNNYGLGAFFISSDLESLFPALSTVGFGDLSNPTAFPLTGMQTSILLNDLATTKTLNVPTIAAKLCDAYLQLRKHHLTTSGFQGNYGIDKYIATMPILLDGIIAPMRGFGCGNGLQLYNCNNSLIDNHYSAGNRSYSDSAFGIVFGGSSKLGIVKNSTLASNKCWNVSARASDGSINLSALSPIYNYLSLKYLSEDSSDTYSNMFPTPTIVNEAFEYVPTTAPTGTALRSISDAERLVVRFGNGDSIPNSDVTEYAPFIGPVACGLMIGDGAVGFEVTNNEIIGQEGYAGRSIGLGIYSGAATMINGNIIAHNTCEVLGQTFGICENTLIGTSYLIKNSLFGNKTDRGILGNSVLLSYNTDSDYYNRSFDNASAHAWAGEIASLKNASAFDNVNLDNPESLSSNNFAPSGTNLVTSSGAAVSGSPFDGYVS